jgi:hypothetical protein
MDRWPKLSFETSSGQVGHEFADFSLGPTGIRASAGSLVYL